MSPFAPEQTWVQPDFSAIALRIQRGDSVAESELVSRLTRGVRLMASRRLGHTEDVDDVVNEVFRIAIENIRAGKLQDHRRVLGYIHSILKNIVMNHIKDLIRARAEDSVDSGCDIQLIDRRESPEQFVQQMEMKTLVSKTLLSLCERDREILRRFYLDEQSQEEICQTIGISPTQFRLIKSRAKEKFGVIGRRELRPSVRTLGRYMDHSETVYKRSA